MAQCCSPTLEVDLNGNSDSVILQWDFTAKLPTSDTLLNTIAPVILATPPSPQAVFSGVAVSPLAVQARVTITPPAQTGTLYRTSCTVQTTQGNQFVGKGSFSTSSQLLTGSATLATPDMVACLLGPQNYDGMQDLTQFIVSADVLVANIPGYAQESGQTQIPNTYDLSIIEAWLAAHFYLQNNPEKQSLSTNNVSAAYHGQATMRLSSTRYGQSAMALDFTGYLSMIDKRAVAAARWLGSHWWEGRPWPWPTGVTGSFGTLPDGSFGSTPGGSFGTVPQLGSVNHIG